MNLATTIQLYASPAAGTGSTAANNKGDRQIKEYLQKKQNRLDNTRRRLAPYPEDKKQLKAGGLGSGRHKEGGSQKETDSKDATGAHSGSYKMIGGRLHVAVVMPVRTGQLDENKEPEYETKIRWHKTTSMKQLGQYVRQLGYKSIGDWSTAGKPTEPKNSK